MRRDLTHAQQIVQACHATILAADFFINRPVDNLVLCGVANEAALHDAKRRLESLGVRLKVFVEPDLDNQATALVSEAVYGVDRFHFKKYQLLRERA